ncbi:hypothetical protein LTS10_004112 [Elasticomyces elasticus]|nr:hypothetical protein LTS10_004112 [Elasticomyces elasticus]
MERWHIRKMLETSRGNGQPLDQPPPYNDSNDNEKSAQSATTAWNDTSSYSSIPNDMKKSGRVSTDDSLSITGTLGAAIKTYKIMATSMWAEKLFEIQQDDRPILWARNKRTFWHGPQVNIHTESDHGEIVAACKLSNNCFKQEIRYLLDNPDCTDKATWPVATCGGWSQKIYSFEVDGQRYRWKRTHRKDLGASKIGYKHFKLVDDAGVILAVFIYTRALWGSLKKQMGTLEWFGDVGPKLELTSLVIMMGIQEVIRQSEQAAAANGAGS